MARSRKKSTHRWMWAGAIAFTATYLVSALTGRPSYATGAAVLVTIVFAIGARRVLSGTLLGLCVGVAGAAGIMGGLQRPVNPATETRPAVTRPAPLPPADRPSTGPAPRIVSGAQVELAAVFNVVCCTVVGAVFALLGERRRRMGRPG